MAEFHPIDWAEQHPYMAGGIVFGGGLILLWALGYLGGSSSTSSSDSSASNMAAAYYSAEAAQATAGTQLQMATVAATNQTAQVTAQSNAAVAINQANANASTTIAGSQYAAATQINADQVSGATQLGTVQANDALWASQTANNYAYQTAAAGDAATAAVANTNAYYSYEANAVTSSASLAAFIASLNQVGKTSTYSVPGIGVIQGGQYGELDPNQLQAGGWSPTQIARAEGGP